jgi:hypothetical protein
VTASATNGQVGCSYSGAAPLATVVAAAFPRATRICCGPVFFGLLASRQRVHATVVRPLASMPTAGIESRSPFACSSTREVTAPCGSMTATSMSSTFASVHATATHPPRAAAARMKRAFPPRCTACANVAPRRTWATTPFRVREAITAVPSSATAVVALAPGTRTAAPFTSANAFWPRLNTITSPPAATVSAVRAGGSAATSTSPHALGASAASASRQSVPARRRPRARCSVRGRLTSTSRD